MNIVVRASDEVINWARVRPLRQADEYYIWRHGCPQEVFPGDRVYFYRDGEIVGFCTYKKCDYPDDAIDQHGNRQEGPAIYFGGPYQALKPPFTASLKGPWRIRYVRGELFAEPP